MHPNCCTFKGLQCQPKKHLKLSRITNSTKTSDFKSVELSLLSFSYVSFFLNDASFTGRITILITKSAGKIRSRKVRTSSTSKMVLLHKVTYFLSNYDSSFFPLRLSDRFLPQIDLLLVLITTSINNGLKIEISLSTRQIKKMTLRTMNQQVQYKFLQC